MTMSGVLVILPRFPSAATRSVVAGLEVASRALPTLPALSVVHNISEAVEGISKGVLEGKIAVAERKKSESVIDQKTVKGLWNCGFRNFIFVGGKHEALDALNLEEIALELSLNLKIQLIPDDFTNSLFGTQHCLGYGSLAYSFAVWIAGEDFDNASFFNGIKVLVTPDRDAGWIALASTLSSQLQAARSIHNIGPHVICLPEQTFCSREFVTRVTHAFQRYGRATVVVAEAVMSQISGIALPTSDQNSSAGIAALQLSEFWIGLLQNSPVRENAPIRSEFIPTYHKTLIQKLSDSDRTESYSLAAQALQNIFTATASNGMIGMRSVATNNGYKCEFIATPFEMAAYKQHRVPACFFPDANGSVSNAFLKYTQPLMHCSVNLKEMQKVRDKNRASPQWDLAQ